MNDKALETVIAAYEAAVCASETCTHRDAMRAAIEAYDQAERARIRQELQKMVTRYLNDLTEDWK